MGIKTTRAIGSKFDSISLGSPWVDMVAACETKLLFNWLYVSPFFIKSTSTSGKLEKEQRLTHSTSGTNRRRHTL